MLRLVRLLGLFLVGSLPALVGAALPPVHAPQAVAQPTGAIEVQVTVEPGTTAGTAEDAMEASLRIVVQPRQLQATRVPPRQVRVIVDRPAALGGRFMQTVELGQAPVTLTVPVNLPPGPGRLVTLPVRVVSGNQALWYQEVRLTKGGPWWIAGPFPGGIDVHHDTVFGPEANLAEVDLNATYEGRDGRRVGWQLHPPQERSENGMYLLQTVVPNPDNSTAYAYAVATVPEATPVKLLVGSDDSIKVWHNGALVLQHREHRGSEPGQNQAELTLAPGRNTFLLKLVNDDGWWGWHFDLQSPDGGPVPGLQWAVGAAPVPLADPELRLRQVTRTTARLHWQSDAVGPATVHLVPAQDGRRLVPGVNKEAMVQPVPGAPERTIRVNDASTRHEVALTGLTPGQRYLVWVDPAVGGTRTEKLAFYTAPPAGQTMYIHSKIVAVYFNNVVTESDAERPGADAPGPEAQIEATKQGIDHALRWYWVNSGLTLNFEVDYVVDNRLHVVPDDNPYGVGYAPDDEERFRTAVEAAGLDLADYDSRLFISRERRWNADREQWEQPGTGGGTVGPDNELGSSKCAWRASGDHAWLFCHEHGHGIDALYHFSGGEEYLFNHFQPWDGTANRHGEHWDGNAWLLWWWNGFVTRQHQSRPFLEPDLWFRTFQLRFGQVVRTADRDNDGVPDHDPRVPIDEARLGSSPNRADTDGDGLSDRREVMATSWLEEGHSENFGTAYPHMADPTNPDTDGDGIRDGLDPYPVYPIDTLFALGDAPRPFATAAGAGAEVTYGVGVDDDTLTLTVSANAAPTRLRIMLDADNDGWYVGADNLMFEIRPAGGQNGSDAFPVDASGRLRVGFNNCGVPGKWPFWDGSRVDLDTLSWTQEDTAEGFRGTLRIARRPADGIDLVPGEQLGLHLAMEPAGDAARRAGWITAFEPHSFVPIVLVRPTASGG